MSTIVKVRCEDQGVIYERKFNDESERSKILEEIFQKYKIDGYVPEELNEDWFDCMNCEEDIQYTISVYDENESDPFVQGQLKALEIESRLRQSGAIIEDRNEHIKKQFEQVASPKNEIDDIVSMLLKL